MAVSVDSMIRNRDTEIGATAHRERGGVTWGGKCLGCWRGEYTSANTP